MKEFIKKLIGRLEEEKNETYSEMTLLLDKEYLLPCNMNQIDMEEYRCSTFEEAISIVNELAEEYKPCTKSCTDCEAYDLVKHNCPKFCKVIKETIEEIKEEYNNGWIPCEVRLPEKYCHCLVTRRNDYEDGFDTDVREDCFIELEGVWDWQSTFEGLVDNIIAWQPLPQPYTEQRKPTWKKQTMNRFERVE